MDTIDYILKQHSADKADPHRYGPVYDRMFPERIRLDATAILELGVANGCSLRAWHEAFPFAAIVGFDINPSLVDYSRYPRIKLYVGDLSKVNVVLKLTKLFAYDLIVDDASHKLADQLLSLFILWPALKPGGVYVIEEFDVTEGRGPEFWREHVLLFHGACLLDAPCRAGTERLLVVRKAYA